jgi:histamine receptor H2
VQPLYILFFSFGNQLFHKVVGTIGYLSVLASVTNMFAVTVDRFLAIRHPFKYLSFATKKRAILVILTGWSVSVLMTVVCVGIMKKNEKNFLFSGYTFLSLVVTINIYIYLLIVAKREHNKVVTLSIGNDSIHGNQNLQSGQKRELKACRTIAIVVGGFIICWTPFLVFITLSPLRNVNRSRSMMMYYIFKSFAFCNSAINPCIYCARNSRYREAFKKLLGRKGNNQINAVGGGGVVLNERYCHQP